MRKREHENKTGGNCGEQGPFPFASFPLSESLKQAIVAVVGSAIGTLRSEDGDGSENVAKKVNSRSFNLHRDYSKSLTLSHAYYISFNSSNAGNVFGVEF